MKERTEMVTTKGNPLTLVGNEVRVGDAAPDFEVLSNDLAPVRFSSFRGKVCIVSSVASLDTCVCETETRRFNDEAGRLSPDVAILTISMDLPFAQKRSCGAAGVTRVQTLSDHRDASFGRHTACSSKNCGCSPGRCSWWIETAPFSTCSSSRRSPENLTMTRY
jgi:thiol peroxidase